MSTTSYLPADASPDVDGLLRAIEQLPDTELDTLVQRTLSMRAARRAPHLASEESELLQEINRWCPEETLTRYAELIRTRRDGTLTSDQHTELMRLNTEIEQANVARLERLARLAVFRHVTLPTLMQQLGVRPTA